MKPKFEIWNSKCEFVWHPGLWICACCIAFLLALAGCAAPLGADRVTPRLAYQQVEANPLSPGKPSAGTVSLLHRYDLSVLADSNPEEAIRRLHEKAVATGERDLLFALAEVSYVAGEKLRRSVKPWETSDPRDYYLGSAIYAYLFLFGQGRDPAPDGFDRRFRIACDLYNYGLGWALSAGNDTNAVVQLEGGRRRLPVGEIELRFDHQKFPWPMEDFEKFLVADQFRVRGFSTRNREAGVGAPLIAVGKLDPALRIQRASAATVFLRGPDQLTELTSGKCAGSLELYSAFDESSVTIGKAKVPLETDITTPGAYLLNQSFVWAMAKQMFLSPGKAIHSQILLSQPYRRGRVPVVFVHGTFSSPVWWGEMVNTLNADPVLRQHFQFWQFLYSSSNPLVISANELRDQLTAQVQKLDPGGTDPALQEMVVIGHSQGGLLTKLTATDTGDRLWRALSDKPLEEYGLTEAQKAEVRKLLFFKPLPFVRRVVFISTPHHGSYLAVNFVRNIVYKLVALPASVANKGTTMLKYVSEKKLPLALSGRVPTSLDGMSPRNPVLLSFADVPVAPGVTAHSIIPVKGNGDYHTGRDGVVSYQSAHVDYVESELVVRSGHSCQDKPATIEEVRRILHKHLEQLKMPAAVGPER
jgi:pimeloyl-ACP methyl ester carboxylesterase